MQRRLIETMVPSERLCLTYCGDDRCTCRCHPRFRRQLGFLRTRTDMPPLQLVLDLTPEMEVKR